MSSDISNKQQNDVFEISQRVYDTGRSTTSFLWNHFK